MQSCCWTMPDGSSGMGISNCPDCRSGTFEFLHRLPTLPIKPGAYRWKAGVYDGHQWTDGWWALPEMVVGTKPMTNTGDEFQGILNLPCELEVRALDPFRK